MFSKRRNKRRAETQAKRDARDAAIVRASVGLPAEGVDDTDILVGRPVASFSLNITVFEDGRVNASKVIE